MKSYKYYKVYWLLNSFNKKIKNRKKLIYSISASKKANQ